MTQYNGDTSDVSRTDLYDKLGNRIHKEETLDVKCILIAGVIRMTKKVMCKSQYDSRYTYDDLK